MALGLTEFIGIMEWNENFDMEWTFLEQSKQNA
jgi:hypothetical protein